MFFKTLLIGKKVDFVLIDTYSTTNFWYTFYVSQLCRIMGIPYIPILRGGNLAHRLNNSPKISRLIFSNSYRNIAPSGFLYEAFLNHKYPNLILIPNTISISEYNYKLRMMVNPKLLWVRAFSKIYNPEMALKVYSKLKRVYPNAELCMVGPYKDLTKETVQQEIISFVTQNSQNISINTLQSIHEFRDPDFLIFTNQLDLTGNYKNLSQIAYLFETKFDFSKVVSLDYFIEKKNNSSNLLHLKIIFQNYENIK